MVWEFGGVLNALEDTFVQHPIRCWTLMFRNWAKITEPGRTRVPKCAVPVTSLRVLRKLLLKSGVPFTSDSPFLQPRWY